MYDVWSRNPAFLELFIRTPHPMYVYDQQTLRFLAVNPVAIETYGYSAEQFSNMTLYGLRTPSEQTRLREHLALPTSQVGDRGRWQHQKKDGTMLYVDITTYALTFDSRAAQMVLAIDVTDRVMAEQKIAQHVADLENALESTMGALSTMCELRDPYTAGHQTRVGKLARAIAVQMGLNEHMQEGVGVMGLVHDIGKIGIPVDLLNKPSELHDSEYELVKRHAQMGYDILARLRFKWPVAEAVLQHHERLAGTGDTNPLRASDIRLEGNTLAVADGLESMASRRPYRGALGESAACDELISGAGTLYDPDVVHACVSLCRERGYTVH
jgi:PAS domain S-box-containing protein